MARRFVSRCGRAGAPALLVALAGLGAAPARAAVEVDERLGARLPLDVAVVDDDGRTERLGAYFDGRPVLLNFVYYRCPSVCNALLSGVSDVLGALSFKPGQDLRVLSLSFNPDEGPDLARRKKDNYYKRYGRELDPRAWRFLTASPAAIAALTEAAGFRYERVGDDYNHPAVLIAVAPDGMISRYLYGVRFLPFDVQLALHEASLGRTGPTISKVLMYCFSYDPVGKTYAFNLLKVSGTLTLAVLGAFAGFLVLGGRRRGRQGAGDQR